MMKVAKPRLDRGKLFFQFGFGVLIIILSSIIYFKKNNIKGAQTLPEITDQSSVISVEKPKPLIYYNRLTNEQKDSINVLLLGLDGRAGDSKPRCDGIHMISFIEKDNKIIITSIPRGTYINLPGVASESAYISNACHYKGIDYAVSEIEKITGLHADYLVKVGFSQATGIFRLLSLPTTSTLQFLRNRRNNLGDFQRSHNQALFIKDLFINYFDRFMSLPNALKYITFTLLDTNIDYAQADNLLDKIQKSGLYKDQNNIILTIKPTPNYLLSDLHYSFQEEDLTQTTDPQYQEYQNEINSLIVNIIQKADYQYTTNNKAGVLQIVTTPFEQKLWEQVDDEQYRNELHFQLLRLFVLSSPQSSNNTLLVKDFIEQMATYQDQLIKQQGQELLDLYLRGLCGDGPRTDCSDNLKLIINNLSADWSEKLNFKITGQLSPVSYSGLLKK